MNFRPGRSDPVGDALMTCSWLHPHPMLFCLKLSDSDITAKAYERSTSQKIFLNEIDRPCHFRAPLPTYFDLEHSHPARLCARQVEDGSSIDGLPGASTFSTVQLSRLHISCHSHSQMQIVLARTRSTRRTRGWSVEERAPGVNVSWQHLCVSVELRPRPRSCEILAPLRLRSWELAGPLA
jgi:hypothetical protein